LSPGAFYAKGDKSHALELIDEVTRIRLKHDPNGPELASGRAEVFGWLHNEYTVRKPVWSKGATWQFRQETYPTGFKPEGLLVSDESDRPYYADYWGRLLAEERHPPIAQNLADKFYDSLPFEKRTPHRDKIRVNFIRWFFNGFKNPNGSMTGGELGEENGFVAGQQYRRDHEAELGSTMTAFGYEPIQVRGLWTVSFEHSGFVPENRNGEKWWLEGIVSGGFDLPKDYEIPSGGVNVLVDGFLSSEGQFGHLGMYKHEILVRGLTLSKPPNQMPVSARMPVTPPPDQ
jgi:hypothetical protein